MMYPFMTLNDDTEITHSEMKPDGHVKVYIETPDDFGSFHNATCWLPNYKWEDIKGYSCTEINYFDEFIHSVAHLIIELSQEGGFDNTSNISLRGDDSMPELSRFEGMVIKMTLYSTINRMSMLLMESIKLLSVLTANCLLDHFRKNSLKC